MEKCREGRKDETDQNENGYSFSATNVSDDGTKEIIACTDMNEKENLRKWDHPFLKLSSAKRRRYSPLDKNCHLTETDEKCVTLWNRCKNSSESKNVDACNTNACTTPKIKSEPNSDNETVGDIDVMPSSSYCCNAVDIKPEIKVEKVEESSTLRQSCGFGIRCYRRNAMHRIDEAHPGDIDYRRPNYPPPPKGTPDCPYGYLCYRRNPIHFEQFNHPPEKHTSQADFKKIYKHYRLRLRRQQEQLKDIACNKSNNNFEQDDDWELEDPYSNDEYLDPDYVPKSNEDDEDYDACDTAEE